MAKMIKAIKLTPRDQRKHASNDSSGDDTTKDTLEVKYDPNLDLQLRDILNKLFSYRGSIILGFPCLSDEQVEKNADHIGKVLCSQTNTSADPCQGNIKVHLVDVQIKKSAYEQLKEAVDKFNSEAGPGDPTYKIVQIYTDAQQHILAVSENKNSDNRYPCIFKLVPSDRTADDDDLSTIFVQLTDIDPRTQTAVNMFINFIDDTIGLPMGTIQRFGSGDNNLYTYNPLPPNSNDPPPTGYYELLCYWARKVSEDELDFAGRFLFKISGEEIVYIYPILNLPIQRISKDDDTSNAVIKESHSFLIIEPVNS